jgi:hypothetical protein
MCLFREFFSFPRSAWECRLDALRGARDAERPEPAFPRRAWERETGLQGILP